MKKKLRAWEQTYQGWPDTYVVIRELSNGDINISAWGIDRDEREFLLREPSDNALAAILERHRDSGNWDFIEPDEVGALTGAPIIAYDCLRNDDGVLVDAGEVFWFPDYQIDDEIALILSRKGATFRKAE